MTDENPTEDEGESESVTSDESEYESVSKTVRIGDTVASFGGDSEGQVDRMIEERRKLQTLADLASDPNLKETLGRTIIDIADTRNDVHALMSPSNARELADRLNSYADQVEAIGRRHDNHRYPDDYPDREESEWVEADEDSDDDPDISSINSATDW